jgi:hypothetical protein
MDLRFYPFWLDFFSTAISLVAAAISFYYASKITRLGRGVNLLAIKGGSGPTYIALAIFFIIVERILNLIAEPLIPYLTADVAFALDDSPAALAVILLAVGLKKMYALYIKSVATPNIHSV